MVDVRLWRPCAMLGSLPHDTFKQPQGRRPFGDLLGVHDGLGLELDVDRAAAGQVGGR